MQHTPQCGAFFQGFTQFGGHVEQGLGIAPEAGFFGKVGAGFGGAWEDFMGC